MILVIVDSAAAFDYPCASVVAKKQVATIWH
jgi:hypothetical protein